MKKINMTLVCVFTIFVLISSTVSTTADYPTGTLVFSDVIYPGNSFTWIVKTLDIVGDRYETPDDFYIGDVRINESDKIRLDITEDPDTANDTWYEVYVNGILIPDPAPIELGYVWLWYIYSLDSYLLISPTKYVNSTGTYNLYEQLFEECEDTTFEDESNSSTEITGITYEQSSSVNYAFSMDSDSFIIELYLYYYDLVFSSIYYNLEILEATIKTSVNIHTGLLEEAKSFINWEEKFVDNGTTITHVLGHSNFWMMEESYMPTTTFPELAYVGTFLFGIFVCVVVISLLINKKRKKI